MGAGPSTELEVVVSVGVGAFGVVQVLHRGQQGRYILAMDDGDGGALSPAHDSFSRSSGSFVDLRYRGLLLALLVGVVLFQTHAVDDPDDCVAADAEVGPYDRRRLVLINIKGFCLGLALLGPERILPVCHYFFAGSSAFTVPLAEESIFFFHASTMPVMVDLEAQMA